jgi:hypothetical protein
MQRDRVRVAHAASLSSRGVIACAFVVAGCGVCLPLTARADYDIQLSYTNGVSWKPSMPALSNELTHTAARDVPEGKVPIGGALTAVGAGLDIAMIVDDRWTLPLGGFAAYGAVGSYSSIVTSADGSIARVHPWTTYQLDALLPGLGLRIKERRWMFSATVRTGVTYLHADGVIAGGGGETTTSFADASFLLQAEIEACRRLDPTTRLCLQVAPRVYDFGFMNGATVGLRVEWGR